MNTLNYAFKNLTNIFVITSLGPIPFLLLGMFGELPYFYYILLRWIVCVCWFVQMGNSFIFVIPGLTFFMLFNPVIPFYFNRGIWFFLDIIAIWFFWQGLKEKQHQDRF